MTTDNFEVLEDAMAQNLPFVEELKGLLSGAIGSEAEVRERIGRVHIIAQDLLRLSCQPVSENI